MKRFILTTALVVSLCGSVRAQATKPPADVRTFEITPAAPPSPALKYQLLFDDLSDRRPGNAAILYLDSVLLMGPDAQGKAEKALAAYDAKDMKTFDSLADSLELSPMFQELDLAARREQSDWQSPFREMGIRTLLPHLGALRGVAQVVKVRALRQIEQGKTSEALATLRLGYELSDKVGREPILISALVAINITGMMNDALGQLLSRPDSPNLYWALSEIPTRQSLFRTAFDSGRLGSATASIPDLERVKNGEEITAAQWRSALEYIENLPINEGPPIRRPDAIRDAGPQVLRQAQAQYAQSHRLTSEQAAGIDRTIVLGEFYFHSYEIAYDGMYKLRGLAYPELLAKSHEYSQQVAQWQKEQPANPFMQTLPALEKAVWRFARIDRQLAALAAVEALRSYAAANGGNLPQRLDQIADTPVPQNPATGKPFEYRLENNAATLGDSRSEEQLSYTIKIRK